MGWSHNRCEAMIKVGRVWARCGRTPVEKHHRLTRARGGEILDKAGETYHLMYLCHTHHRMADGRSAYETGLLLDGRVTTNPDGSPLYLGTDEYLTRVFGPVEVRDLRGPEGDHAVREGLRGEAREDS